MSRYVTIGELSNILLDDTLDEFHMEFLRAGKKKRAATDTNSSSGARKRAITDSPIEITSDMDPSSAAKKRAVTELAPEIKFDMDFEIDFDDDFNMEPRQPVSSLNRKKGKEIITID